MDRTILSQLKRYAGALKDARDRGANESDTVMFLVKFFEEVLGWDSFKGEISKESPVKDRFCDIAIKLDGQTKFLVECKAVGIAKLMDKNIEQAEGYAAHSGIRWVLLTNGIDWQMYHLTFAEGEGIQHELAFEVHLLDELDADANALWDKLYLLTKKSVTKGEIDDFWEHKKSLCKGAIVKAIFTESVLSVIRRELNRKSDARVDLDDVFVAVREALSKEALLEAGDVALKKKRRTHKVAKPGVANGDGTDEEEDKEDGSATDTVVTPTATAPSKPPAP